MVLSELSVRWQVNPAVDTLKAAGIGSSEELEDCTCSP